MIKVNQLLLGRILKVTIVLFAVVMLGSVLRKFFSDHEAIELFSRQVKLHSKWLVIVILLMPLNWFFETAKWKKIVSVSEEITWKEAWSGVLSGLAIGSATPNRIGEFAGRVFQLKRTAIHDGISCTLLSSVLQVGVTMLAGIAGLLLVDTEKILHSAKAISWVIIVFTLILAGAIIIRSLSGKAAKYFEVLRRMNAKLLVEVFALSAIRYAVYSLQFVIMLKMCGVNAPAFALVTAVAINYMIVSVIPSVMISELFVRGTVASGVIGALCGFPEAAALAAVITWLLNVGLPAICGMFFVQNLTFFRKQN